MKCKFIASCGHNGSYRGNWESILLYRSVDIISYECGSSVSCWGSTSADMYCYANWIYTDYKMAYLPCHKWSGHTLDSEITNSVLIDNSDDIQRKTKEVASVTFTYARASAQGASPLISIDTLSIDSVGIGLNGTVVRCSDVADPTTSASTTIEIIDTNKISKLISSLLLCEFEQF